MAKKDIKIEITEERINQLINAVEGSNLSEDDRTVIISSLEALVRLDQLVGLKDATIQKLRKIFGKQSERNKESTKDPKDKKEAKGTTGGSGRNGSKDYETAIEVEHPIEHLKPKDQCPECLKGKLYPMDPGIYVKIQGQLPLQPIIHKAEKLRCNLCGAIFEANFKEKEDPKFDPESRAILGMLHYKASLPFYRQETLYKQLGIPLARSTIWLRMEELADYLHVIWKEMLKVAPGGELFYIDDTRAKVLSLLLENELNRENKKFRKGIYTTGVLAELDGTKLVLYLTGRQHSGENIKSLINKTGFTTPVSIMSDALKANDIELSREILKFLCLVHGRRNFVDVEEKYKEESQKVINLISKVYKNEEHCKSENLSKKDRLLYHQTHSKPPMNELKKYIDSLFPDKKVEPNSELGKAIKYLQNHWQGLTAFLRHEGAPLDNNILEQQLRIPVLNRKNWLFYKNEYGAQVGDIILSIIKTCDLNHINAFEYLVAVQKNNEAAKKNPNQWLPWNYKMNSHPQNQVEI